MRYVHETNLYIDERDMSRDKNEKDLSLTKSKPVGDVGTFVNLLHVSGTKNPEKIR